MDKLAPFINPYKRKAPSTATREMNSQISHGGNGNLNQQNNYSNSQQNQLIHGGGGNFERNNATQSNNATHSNNVPWNRSSTTGSVSRNEFYSPGGTGTSSSVTGSNGQMLNSICAPYKRRKAVPSTCTDTSQFIQTPVLFNNR